MRPEKRHPNHPGELGTDPTLAEKLRERAELNARAQAIDVLTAEKVPFLVGGAYAYCGYTGIFRDTKDLDLFPRKKDAERALDVLARHGWDVEKTDEVWIYKAFRGEYYVDFIFSSGNGVATVDDEWYQNATWGEAFGRKVMLVPPEEMIWSKAFVLERERFDGSDVMHLIRALGQQLDWDRLLRRFDRYWEVLLSHVMFFRFAYPTERNKVPEWVMFELLQRSLESVRDGEWSGRMCRGPLLSRVNFRVDLDEWGYQNGRVWDEQDRVFGGIRASGSDLEDPLGGGR